MTSKKNISDALYRAGLEMVVPAMDYGNAKCRSRLPQAEGSEEQVSEDIKKASEKLDNSKKTFESICRFAADILCENDNKH